MTESPSPLTMLFSRHTKRREFIAGLGSAAAWSVVARAQHTDRMRRVSVLMDAAEGSSDGQVRIAAFRGTLQGLGWIEGRNIQIDYRWGGGDVERTHAYAAELVRLKPDDPRLCPRATRVTCA